MTRVGSQRHRKKKLESCLINKAAVHATETVVEMYRTFIYS